MIIKHVTRGRSPRTVHHPLKYSDLETAVGEQGGARVHLAVHFADTPVNARPHDSVVSGADAGSEYRQLVQVHFHPQAHRVPSANDVPWAGEDEPNVIFVDVFPIERDVSKWLPRLRLFITAELNRRVGELTKGGLPSDRWLLRAGLLPETSELEVETTTWTALRRNKATIDVVGVP